MAPDQQSSNKQRIVSTADLLRRGATLLSEACPRCGGLQIRYKERVYCLNEDDLSGLVSGESIPSSIPPAMPGKAAPAQREVGVRAQTQGPAFESDNLSRLLQQKLNSVSKQLEETQDIDEQEKLLGLISKYVDTLNKLKNTNV